jgi:hypothetical protein
MFHFPQKISTFAKPIQKQFAMETMTIQFDKHNAALQQVMQLFLTLGGHIIEQKAETEEYDPEFVAMIKKSHDEIKAGKGKAIKTEDLWN